MSYNLAYSVLTPITNGETGLQLRGNDPRIIDRAFGAVPELGLPSTNLFGIAMHGYNGFYFCSVLLIIGFIVALRIASSPFGLMLQAIQSNKNRPTYLGVNTRPHNRQTRASGKMESEQ